VELHLANHQAISASSVNYAAPKGSTADKFSDLKNMPTDVKYDSPTARNWFISRRRKSRKRVH